MQHIDARSAQVQSKAKALYHCSGRIQVTYGKVLHPNAESFVARTQWPVGLEVDNCQVYLRRIKGFSGAQSVQLRAADSKRIDAEGNSNAALRLSCTSIIERRAEHAFPLCTFYNKLLTES
jgi:hypothetical protein